MLVAIAVFAIGHPSGQKLSNQASRKFGLGGRSSNGGDFDVDSSGGDAVDVSEELAPSETMSEEDREEIAAEEAEEGASDEKTTFEPPVRRGQPRGSGRQDVPVVRKLVMCYQN